MFRGNPDAKSSGHEEYCYRTTLAAVRHFEEINIEELRAQYKDGVKKATT